MDNLITETRNSRSSVELRARALSVTSTLREWGVTPLCDVRTMVEMGEQILADPSGPVDIRRFLPGRMLLQLLTDWVEPKISDGWAYFLNGKWVPWKYRGDGFIATDFLALCGPRATKRLESIGAYLIEMPSSVPDTRGDRVEAQDMSLRRLESGTALLVTTGGKVAFFDLQLASALMTLELPIVELTKIFSAAPRNGEPLVAEPSALVFREDQEGPAVAILACLNERLPS